MRVLHTRKSVLDKLRAVARARGRATVSRAEFMRRTGITGSVLLRLFPSWKAAVTAAGLSSGPTEYSGSDGQLFSELARIGERLGHFPTRLEYKRRSGRDVGGLRRRFGYWWQMPQRLLEWLEKHDPQRPAAEIARREVVALRASLAGRRAPTPKRHYSQALAASWERRSLLRYGPPLDCPGLRHAPTSESGVIFVFGMVCERLGFVVDAIHAHFPDCEAKRRTGHQDKLWEPVRIEFELRASNFRAQGHRLDQCDLIVCWEDDWPDCPLEVLALKDLVVAERKHEPATHDQCSPQERLARELL